MTDCEKYQELISRMLDDDLSKEERDDLAEHVKRCPDCAAVYVAFRSLSESVGGELEEVPHELHEKIMSDARRENLRFKNKAASTNRRWHYVLTAAACLVLIVAAGLSLPKLIARNSEKADVTESKRSDARASARREAAPEAGAPTLGMAKPETAEAETAVTEEADEAAPEYPADEVFILTNEKAADGPESDAGQSAASDNALPAPRPTAAPTLPAPTPPVERPEEPAEAAAEEAAGLYDEDEELIVLNEEQSAWLLKRVTRESDPMDGAPDRELHLLLTVQKKTRRATLLLYGEEVYYVYAEGDIYFLVDASAEEMLEEFGLDG